MKMKSREGGQNDEEEEEEEDELKEAKNYLQRYRHGQSTQQQQRQ
ncbi:unnamed protein product [Schistosoma curassoni]|uniref:Uncharacterized protein n=1 Tax=Schistosoma curassoni TaxID=6186 RepID=A0A183K119_9TREM|nr:unnamed protein product [Schistosoma curassoni]